MATGVFRGVFAIPPTPFHDDGSLDEASLARCVAFCLSAGVHGIVAPVVASESGTLFEEERMRIAELLVGRVAGRVPVIIGVSGASVSVSELYAWHAARIDADGVIAMPPPDASDPEEIIAFYTAVAEAAGGLPVWVQNAPAPLGTPMPPELLARLLDIPSVDYVKEETALAPQAMTRLQALAGDRLAGVMGGMGGRHMLDEHGRGACGTMPACEFADVHVAIWNALERGDIATARRIHTRLLPLLSYEGMYSFALWKQVLVRRGVIASARTRLPGAPVFDADNHRELDAMLRDIDDLLTVSI